MKANRYHPHKSDALAEIAETAKDSTARSKAGSLCEEVKSFNFMLAVVLA